MKFDDFVSALFAAGWRDNCDAQHSEILKLWRKLFPVVADLEDELRSAENELNRLWETSND